MPIIYKESTKEFHLFNGEISYVIEILENGQLGNLYFGKKINEEESLKYLRVNVPCSHAAFCLPVPATLSLQHTRQEYPLYGTGDFRYGAFSIKQENGSRISDFKYVSHKIYAGKKKIEPLPATYVDNDSEASSLEITLSDSVTGTDLVLTYTIYENYPAITRHARFEHKGKEKITLEKAMSLCIDLPDADYQMLHLSGAWGRERHIKERRLEQGVQAIHSMRGISSAEHNPFIALKREETTENQGEVYGFSFVYSGNFLAQVEVCSNDTSRVLMGIHPDNFEWVLQSGESFQTPEVVMVYSDKGLNKMSQTYHKLYSERLARGPWRGKERPVLINNWEATYMDFNEEKILQIAKTAKEAGIELFVLDDGWFGTRDDDTQGLGDWFVNTKKLPGGISGLSRKIEEMGMKFGLWIEPEMTNKNSELYRKHPDWIISTPERFESHSRFQHMLDFSRKEVVDYIHEMIAKVIREAKISYIKWDMNRYMTECYSRAAKPEEQGKVMHKYILGVYDLYTRLINEFPDMLFESCASGGARFDPGMLYFAPQAWCSDNTDAYERVKIQYGTSLAYPVSSVGAHVSAVPNHQVGRVTPLSTRGNVAYFGAFGYELDLNALSKEELEEVKEQVAYYKKYRSLFQYGTFYRIKNPFKCGDGAWMVVSDDKTKAIAAYYMGLNTANKGVLRYKLEGLDPDMRYKVTVLGESEFYRGDQLMNAGLVINRNKYFKHAGDFVSLIFNIEKA